MFSAEIEIQDQDFPQPFTQTIQPSSQVDFEFEFAQFLEGLDAYIFTQVTQTQTKLTGCYYPATPAIFIINHPSSFNINQLVDQLADQVN